MDDVKTTAAAAAENVKTTAASVGRTVSESASSWGSWLSEKAAVLGSDLERVADKAAERTNETLLNVTGTHKKLAVSFLEGLVSGKWGESTDQLSAEFVMLERDGFRGSKDWVIQELNRTDRTSAGTVRVWDGGAEIAYELRYVVQYAAAGADAWSGKRVEVTAFGVLRVHDGQVVQVEQRSDHWNPIK